LPPREDNQESRRRVVSKHEFIRHFHAVSRQEAVMATAAQARDLNTFHLTLPSVHFFMRRVGYNFEGITHWGMSPKQLRACNDMVIAMWGVNGLLGRALYNGHNPLVGRTFVDVQLKFAAESIGRYRIAKADCAAGLGLSETDGRVDIDVGAFGVEQEN
jgi:hypothetical protein